MLLQFGQSTSSSTSPDYQGDSLESRTSDALLVEVECSFQYQLSTDKGDLLKLFNDWGSEYEQAFIATTRNVLRDVMADFTALDVFYNRTAIETEMSTNLMDRLQTDYNAQVQSFQLLDLQLPSTFSQALTNTENLNLNVQTVVNNLTTVSNQVQGQINQAIQDSNVIINNALSFAALSQGNGLAKAAAIQAKFNQQSQQLKNLTTTLGLSQRQLAAYYFYEMQSLSNFKRVDLNLDMPKTVQCMFDASQC